MDTLMTDSETGPLFELHDAVVMRGGKPILSVDSFSLGRGEHVALLGPNGSGKSTFVGLMTREVLPLHRERPPVLFKGSARAVLAEVRKTLGIVSSTMQDQIAVHVPTVDIVAGGLFGTLGIPREVRGVEDARSSAKDALGRLGVADLADRDVMTLSTGQARRALIARALVHDPEVLVFDEPCTGLDPEGMYYVRRSMRALARSGKTIVLVTHYPEDIIPEIERLVLVKHGRVVADGDKDHLLVDRRMSDLYDIPVQVERKVVDGNSGSLRERSGFTDEVENDVSSGREASLLVETRCDEYFSLVSAY